MNIYQKLLEVKKTVEFLKKEASGAQYKYNPSSQVLLAVRDKMNEIGLFLECRIIKHTVHLKMEGGLKENFTELDLEMIWIDVEKPEERIVIPWAGQGVDARETGLGKALTYAEKYFMLKQFNIPTDKDDPDAQPENQGNRSQSPSQPRDQRPRETSPQQPTSAPAAQGGATVHASSRVFAMSKELGWKSNDLNAFATDVLGREVKYPMKDYVKSTEDWEKIEQALLVTKEAS